MMTATNPPNDPHSATAAPASASISPTRDVITFFAVAIGLCFALSTPMVFGWTSPDLNNVVVPILQLTPLIAAIVMWAWRRPASFQQTFATRWRGTTGWLLIGVGVITAVAATQTAIALAAGIWRLQPEDMIVQTAVWIIPVLIMQSLFAIGEEFGWRGWLATRAAAWGFWKLAIIQGLVWMVWHLPVLAVIGDQSLPSIIIYFAGMLPWSPLLLALRWRSGSVWPAVLAHGAINSIRVFLLQSVPRATDSFLIEVIGWVLTLLAAAWLMRGRGSSRLPASEPDEHHHNSPVYES